MVASLDHAMWFHQPFRADEWLLYHQDSPIAHGARGLARGEIFRQDGVLAVTVMQEGLIRPMRTGSDLSRGPTRRFPPVRSRSTRIPTIPRSRPAGPWPAGPRPAARSGCSSPPAATRAAPIPRSIRDELASCGATRPRPRRRRSASPGTSTSTTPTASFPTTRTSGPRSCATCASCDPRRCSAPIRPRCSSATGTSTTVITASPGWATLDAIAPASGNPHYFADQLVDGLTVHEVPTAYLSGTLEPNCWIDISDALERKIDALFCHASQLVETGPWFRTWLREQAEEAGRAAGRPTTRSRSASSRSSRTRGPDIRDSVR